MENGTIEFYTYDYDIDGITFTNKSGYQLTKEGF
jgi:hypothetical protein